MHWLTGSSPNPLHKLWREVGALDDSVQIHYQGSFLTFEQDGHRACLYRDLEAASAFFRERAGRPRAEINRLCRDIKKFTKMGMPVMDIRGVR